MDIAPAWKLDRGRRRWMPQATAFECDHDKRHFKNILRD